jgi:hypothetical protein
VCKEKMCWRKIEKTGREKQRLVEKTGR